MTAIAVYVVIREAKIVPKDCEDKKDNRDDF